MENIESLMQRLRPTSGVELEKWIQTFPEELGLRLLEEHWRLLLPKEPGELGVSDWWGRLQKRHDPSTASSTPRTREENRRRNEEKAREREQNLREYLAKLDAAETAKN